MSGASGPRLIARALIAAAIGAAAGVAALGIVAGVDANLTFEFDRDPPSFATGFYPAERDRDQTFVWTSAQAGLTLPELDRQVDWRCVLRLRGARPTGIDQPLITIAIDGVPLSRRLAAPDYEDIEVVVPARSSRRGLSLSIGSDPTFVPGPSDKRQLGAQMDRLSCSPAGLAWPPGGAVRAVAVASAAFAIAFVLIGASVPVMTLGVVVISAAQAVALAMSAAMHSGYSTHVAWLAVIAAVVLVVLVQLTARTPFALSGAARFVAAFSIAAVYVKLLALLHPSKLVIDAVFHARRLDWVLDGRFYFTQPMPDGVAFPYAIGLYLFAAPFAWLTNDHVLLLRVVVTAAEAAAGALLYLIVVRVWGDRLAGACAVVLFHLVPVPYVVIGNANMTNAFGQSAALATVALAAVLTYRRLIVWPFAVLTMVATLAYLSHVSIVTMLPITLMAIAVLYWWQGGELRMPARSVLVAAIAAGVLAAVLYYGHFGDAYRSLARVRTSVTAEDRVTPSTTGAAVSTPIHRRAATALVISARDIGWPVLALAGLGAFRGVRYRRVDRLVLVVAAWVITYLAFVAFAAVVPVGARFERYAAEFVGRVDFATYPAAVILAADAAAWMLRATAWIRVSAAVLLTAAVIQAVEQWFAWIR